MSTLTTEFPGYVAGSWTIDPVHSEVSASPASPEVASR
jgi:hypothetical protein